MLQVLAVGGAPASGKTTLFQALLEELGPGNFRKAGLVSHHVWNDIRLMLLGDYRKKGFAGTDRMSMAVQPQALGFLQSLSGLEPSWKVLFEGDRLFNLSFLKALQEFSQVTCWILETSKREQDKRHQQRGDSQNTTWLKGRMSKLKKIAANLQTIPLPHETLADTKRLVKKLLKFCREEA